MRREKVRKRKLKLAKNLFDVTTKRNIGYAGGVHWL